MIASKTFKFKKLSKNATVPSRRSTLLAGFHLFSAKTCIIPPRGHKIVKTDIQISPPEGCYCIVDQNSGSALEAYIEVFREIIDQDYRGNVGIVMFNHSKHDFTVSIGDIIAQIFCIVKLTTEFEEYASKVLRFIKLSENATFPSRGSGLPGGYDLFSAENFIIPAEGHKVVKTDIQIALPEGCYCMVEPSSGSVLEAYIEVLSDIIDQDYRENVEISLFNHSKQDFPVSKGDIIARIFPNVKLTTKFEENASTVIEFKKLSENATLPSRGSAFAAGYDLYSAEQCIIPAKGTKVVKTDIQIYLPDSYHCIVRPRSGSAIKNFIRVRFVNRDDFGNVGIVLFNRSKQDFPVSKGDIIAQLICNEKLTTEFEENFLGRHKFRKLSEDAKLPSWDSPLAAVYDIFSSENCVIPAENIQLVQTDIQMSLPDGCYVRVLPRSGSVLKDFIEFRAINQDYRGNVGISLLNCSKRDFPVSKGERIAQIIFIKFFTPELQECASLDIT